MQSHLYQADPFVFFVKRRVLSPSSHNVFSQDDVMCSRFVMFYLFTFGFHFMNAGSTLYFSANQPFRNAAQLHVRVLLGRRDCWLRVLVFCTLGTMGFKLVRFDSWV